MKDPTTIVALQLICRLLEKNMLDDHRTHMRAALAQAERALQQGAFPVGCVMTYKKKIICSGRREITFGPSANEIDHAEIQAIRSLFHEHPGINTSRITVYSTMEPCLMCYATLLLNGFRKIVYAFEDVMGGGTNLDLSTLNPLYRDMKVQIVPGVCRDESLALFKTFFSDPRNSYWQESLLAKHILEQKLPEGLK